MRKAKLKLRRFLSISITTFLLLILIFFALPAILLSFNVPSFNVGGGIWWILRWKNEVDNSGISFNLVILINIAVTIRYFAPL